jgi:uncharacterized heparinase superfamily protein
MKRLSRLDLLFRTSLYLRPAQIWHRCQRNFRIWSWEISGKKAPLPTQWKLAEFQPLYIGLHDISHEGPWSEKVEQAVKRAKETAILRFHFLNKTVDFHGEPEWHDQSLSRLWRFHLHYFEFVNDLLVWSAVEKDETAYTTFRELVNSWIDSNRTLGGDGWHPYTLSERLVNWLNATPGLGSQLEADQGFQQSFLSSLYGQGQFLFDNLELDVRGNHLVKNLRALLWCGVAFEGVEPNRWFRKALALLRQELEEQVLSDGGHFERSPGYHLLVLKDCLEIAIWLRRNRNTAPEWLEDVLRRMIDYLVAILPTDGQMPLLKDTVWEYTLVPSDLLAAAALYFDDDSSYKLTDDLGLYVLLLFGLSGWQKFKEWPATDSARNSMAFRETGHYVMRDEGNGDYLIFDAGKVCPEYLPAHAHADMLSYELMVSGRRVVVDSGVYEYAAGPWRDYFRSTRAHNTIEIAGQNQSEVWDSFRVARRARPGHVVWQESDKHVLVQGRHDGYRRLPVKVIHRRTLVWQKRCFLLVVDELQGKGRTEAANHVHLHPGLNFDAIADSAWEIEDCPLPVWLTAFGNENHAVIKGQMDPFRQGWYSEKFGELEPNTVLSLCRGGIQ